jgi:hypothetical protein
VCRGLIGQRRLFDWARTGRDLVVLANSVCWPVGEIGICKPAALIAIVMAEPRHREAQAIFIAAFRNIVEVVVSVHRGLGAARVGRIGVEDIAVFVPVEDTDTWRFLAGELRELKVELDLAFDQ